VIFQAIWFCTWKNYRKTEKIWKILVSVHKEQMRKVSNYHNLWPDWEWLKRSKRSMPSCGTWVWQMSEWMLPLASWLLAALLIALNNFLYFSILFYVERMRKGVQFPACTTFLPKMRYMFTISLFSERRRRKNRFVTLSQFPHMVSCNISPLLRK
jgi:hypothetical protein